TNDSSAARMAAGMGTASTCSPASRKRAALKQLFRDPRFNIMDGLDTYIDDYTKADPIPPDIVADLLQRGFGSTSETGGGEAVATPRPNAVLLARGAPAPTGETPPAASVLKE